MADNEEDLVDYDEEEVCWLLRQRRQSHAGYVVERGAFEECNALLPPVDSIAVPGACLRRSVMQRLFFLPAPFLSSTRKR
jgi:hypothetical protein